MSKKVKEEIVQSVEAAMSLLKTADSNIFEIQNVIKNGKTINRIELVFLDYLSAFMDLDVMFSEEFKTYHKPHYDESTKYSKIPEEQTPSVLKFKTETKIKDCIVHNPSSSQAWPNILVIKDNVGYPLEIKSSSNVPKMNSGIFRLNTPYIAIKKDPDESNRVMRLFMGNEMVTSDEIVEWREKIEQISSQVKELNAPGYRRNYDVFFTANDWFPVNYVDKHKESVVKYINE